MLNSLEIKNFRNLSHLKINSLDRINLFTGKNNTGKSTILEALSIYATKGDIDLIYKLLDGRGENYRPSSGNKNLTETNLKTLSSLFTNREVGFAEDNSILIGSIYNNKLLEKQRGSNEEFVSLKFVKYYDERIDENDNQIRHKRIILDDKEESLLEYSVGLELKFMNNSFIYPLNRESRFIDLYKTTHGKENYQFIQTRNIDRDINGKLWDSITLSDKEKYVIDALKIIEPDVERIAFIEENSRERVAVIKLSNSSNILPLRSMGDGINRVLTIILALVNADNGFLLIDEFENGFHYTVQEKLWEIIFSLSATLNIQVFATTHSEDCIAGFEKVLNSSQNKSDGKLIRLDAKNGEIKQVEFDANELKIANKQDIEIR